MRGSSSEEGLAVLFATSNPHKVKEAELVLARFGLRVRQVDAKGMEMQSDDLREIASRASEGASKACASPVIVEDAGLFVEGLNGFPGPYSAYAYRTLGLERFLALMDTVEARWAVFRSAVAYCSPGGRPVVFEGTVRGWIVANPRGQNGFGFDPVFAPEGSGATLAEMTAEEKSGLSHRGAAMRKFAAWLVGTP